MTAIEVRNKVVSGLRGYFGVAVNLSEQVSEEPGVPYIIYSVTSPYIPGNTLGHFGHKASDGGNITETRAEQAGMTMSFTVCSQSRKGDDGCWIWGEDEAMGLAEKVQGWFLHTGRRFLSPEVVVESVGNAAPRSTLMVDEEANRYGFDVLVKYIREDAVEVGGLGIAVSKGGGR